ncbi:unnamed protein product [Nesidiocoris tenuis]|uniref:Uncharacterized protein n=1 Tax=Nesidiocoris tenuis TaxID=355587 RepID=A0A6H5H157_9HEMI|nr:unnamed protein product [Nesidiocoris tenuis]
MEKSRASSEKTVPKRQLFDGIQRYFLARCVSSVDLAATYGRWAENLYAVSVKWIKADFSQTNHYDHIDGELADLDDIGILGK